MYRDRFPVALQVVSALFLSLGWWRAERARVSSSADMIILVILWFIGSAAAAITLRLLARRRLLSFVLLALNILGLLFAGIAILGSHREVY
jgi:hypothetical protein